MLEHSFDKHRSLGSVFAFARSVCSANNLDILQCEIIKKNNFKAVLKLIGRQKNYCLRIWDVRRRKTKFASVTKARELFEFHGGNAPKLLIFDSIDGTFYTLEDWIKGDCLSIDSLESSTNALKNSLKLIESLTQTSFKRFGEVAEEDNYFINHSDYSSFVCSDLERILRVDSLPLSTEFMLQDLRSEFISLAANTISLRNEYYIQHGDFHHQNLISNLHGKTYLIDWEYVHLGSPYVDVANLLAELAIKQKKIDQRHRKMVENFDVNEIGFFFLKSIVDQAAFSEVVSDPKRKLELVNKVESVIQKGLHKNCLNVIW